jgi:hypothetical protein
MTTEASEREGIAVRILHILSIYPKVSPSMLQITLNTPAPIWRPALEELVAEERVTRSMIVAGAPSGRHHSYTILTLGPNAGVRPVEVDGVARVTEGLNDHGSRATV